VRNRASRHGIKHKTATLALKAKLRRCRRTEVIEAARLIREYAIRDARSAAATSKGNSIYTFPINLQNTSEILRDNLRWNVFIMFSAIPLDWLRNICRELPKENYPLAGIKPIFVKYAWDVRNFGEINDSKFPGGQEASKGHASASGIPWIMGLQESSLLVSSCIKHRNSRGAHAALTCSFVWWGAQV
jgi:hypothetical protein